MWQVVVVLDVHSGERVMQCGTPIRGETGGASPSGTRRCVNLYRDVPRWYGPLSTFPPIVLQTAMPCMRQSALPAVCMHAPKASPSVTLACDGE